MRLIDADALIQEMYRIVTETNSESIHIDCIVDEAVGNAPTVDAVPVVHGEWLPTNDENKKRCSRCDVIHLIAQYPAVGANLCPACGAKMDGGNEE